MGNSTLNSLYRNLGLEDLVEEPPVEEVPADLSGEESVEGALVDALPEQEAAETDVEQIDDLGGDLETLENVKEAMENACAQSMLSKDAVVFARLAVASVYRRWGVSADPVPSMESIDPATTVSQMRVSMEGLGDTLKKWWQAFMAKLKGMINNVKQFVMKLFDASPKIKARAESIKKAAASGKPIDGKIKDFRRSTIQIKGKAATGDEIVKDLELMAIMVSVVSEKFGEYDATSLKELDEHMKKLVTDASITSKALVKDTADGIANLWTLWKRGGSDDKTRTTEDLTGWATEPFISDNVLWVQYPKNIPDDVKIGALSSIKYGIGKVAEYKELEAGELDPLNVDTINKICDAVAAVCDKVGNLKASYAKQEADVNRAMNDINNAAGKVKSDDAEANRRVRETIIVIGHCISASQSFRRQVPAFVLTACRSALEYCAKSFQAGEAAKEEPKAEGAAA